MSDTIDKKVVQLEFDNAKFKTGITETIQAVKNLDKNLTFKRGEESLKNISVASSKVDFSDIVKGTEEVGGRLSGLKNIAQNAFNGIQGIASGFMKGFGIAGLLSSIPAIGQSISGGISRAQKISQAKFTMEGLNVEWKDIYKDINNSVEGTAYGLDQAASAASQLVASGVQVGDQMETVLKSIAGLAAMTGSDYDGIANIMTTVAGQGKLMTMQLRQLEARGFNAAASLTEFMKQFEGFEDLTEADVRALVTDGGISFELFSAAMSQYADQAAKANNTFSGAMSNIKSALSRTTADFFEEVMGMNGVVPVLNDIRELVNGINKTTNLLMHNDIDAETFAVTRYGVIIKGVTDGLKQVHEAFDIVMRTTRKTETGEDTGVIAFFEHWKNAMDSMAPVFENFFGFINAGVKNITMFGLNLSTVFAEILRITFTFLRPISEAFSEVFGVALYDVTEAMNEGAISLADFLAQIKPSEEVLNGIKFVFSGIFNTIRFLITIISGPFIIAFNALAKVAELVGKAFEFIFEKINEFMIATEDVRKQIGDFFSGVLDSFLGGVNDVSKSIGGFFSTIKDVVFNILGLEDSSQGLDRIFGRISESLSNFDINNVISGLSNGFSNLVEFLKPIGSAIGSGLKDALGFLKTIDIVGIFNNIKNSLFDIGNSIADVLGIKKAFADVGDSISDSAENVDVLGEGIKTVAEIVRDTGISAIGDALRFVFDRIKNVWDFLSPILTSIKDGLVKTFEIVKTEISKSGITFEPFLKFFESLKTGLGELFENGINLDSIAKFVSNIGASIGDLVGNIGPKFADLMGNIGTSLTEQVEGPLGSFYNMVVTIGDLLINLPDRIAGLPKALGDALSGFSGIIRNPFAIEKAYADNGLSQGVDEMSETTGDAVDSLSTIAEVLSNPLKAVGDFFTNVFSTTTESIGTSIDKGIAAINFQNIRTFILEVGSIGALAGSIWGIYEFDMLLNSARGFLTNVSGVIENMGKVLNSIKDSIDTYTETIKKTARSNNFLKYVLGFAGSILMLAGALYLISTIDSNKLVPAVVTLTVMMFVMGAFVTLFEFLAGEKMSKLFSTTGGTSAILTILGMAVSMLLLANAIGKLGSMDPGQLQQGMQSVMLLMLVLGVMAGIIEVVGGMSDGMSGAASLIAMAVGLMLLIKAVEYLSVIDWDVLLENLGKAAVMMIMLIGAIWLLNKASKEMVNVLPALVGLAIGIGAIAGALVLLNLAAGDDVGKLIIEMFALSLGILALGGAMRIISGFEGSMIKGGAGIAIMAGALIEMSLAIGLLNLATGGNIGAMAVQLLILVGALAAIALILSFLGNAGPKTTAAAISVVLITAALAGFVGIIILMGLLPWEKVGQGLLFMLAALVEFAAMVVGLSYLSGFIMKLGISLSTLGIALALIAGAFLAFGLALSILAGLAPAAFANIADGIVAFADRISAGGDSIIRAAQVFGEAFAMLIVGFFGRLAEEIGKGISNISNSVKGKEGEIFEGAKSLASALVAGFIGGLVGIGELVIGAIGEGIKGAMDGFANIMAETGTTMNYELTQAMQDHPEQYENATQKNLEAVDKAMSETDAGTEGGEKIAENTVDGYEEKIDSEMEGVDISDAAAKPIENIDEEPSLEAARGFFGDVFSPEKLQLDMQGLGSSIPTDIVSGIFDGSKGINMDPSELLGNMGLNGESLSLEGTNVGNNLGSSISSGTMTSLSSPENVNPGINTQLENLRGRSGDYEAVGKEHGGAYTGGISTGIAESGTDTVVSNAVTAFSSGITTAGEVGAQTGREYGARQIEAISSMGTVIAMTVKTNLAAAADQSDPVSSGHLIGTRQGEGTVQGIQSKVGDITNTVSAGLTTAAQDSDPGGKGDQAGTWFAEGAQYGVSNNISGMSDTVASAFNRAARESDPGGKGDQAGQWFDEGMAWGIDANVWRIREAAARAALAAKAAADAELDAQSPSREMMKRGRWFDEGIAIGMDQYRSVVSDAAAGVADDAMSNTSTAMSALGGLVDGIDWDADPVITPVLDLDSFRADAATMSSFMPDSQVVSANMINRLGSENSTMQIAQNETQNGNNFYITLDWKAGTSANQMVSELADELKLLNLTGGR